MDNQPDSQQEASLPSQPQSQPENQQQSQPTDIVIEPEKKIGRPTVISETIAKKIIEALQWGATVEEAAYYGGVVPATFYNECKRNKQFLEETEAARKYLQLEAKRNVSKSITQEKSLDTSKWLLEKYDKGANNSLVQSNTQINVFQDLKKKFFDGEITEDQTPQEDK